MAAGPCSGHAEIMGQVGMSSGSETMLAQRGWRPSKFIATPGGGWRSAPAHVNISSRLFADKALASYVAAIRKYARGTIADLGCGNAPLAGIYAPHVEKMLWIDWPASMHQQVKLDREQDLNAPLDLPDASVDTVLMTDVLEHIREPDRLVAETFRVLRPGGRAIIGVPFLYWLHEEPHDHHRYSIHKLRDFAASHGFSVLEEHVNGGGLDVVRDLLTKSVYVQKFPLPAALVHYATGGLFALLSPVSRRMRDVMPMGYTVVFGKD